MDKITRRIRYIGFYQLAGGVLGILNTIRLLLNVAQINGGILFVLLLILALYSYSVYCGYLLVKNRMAKGLNLSVYNQLLQVIGFGVLGFAFNYSAGIYAGISVNLTNDTLFSLMLGFSKATITLNRHPEFTELSLNVVALILLNVLLNLKSKWEKREQMGS